MCIFEINDFDKLVKFSHICKIFKVNRTDLALKCMDEPSFDYFPRELSINKVMFSISSCFLIIF